MGFSRQEYWSGLPFPSAGDFPNPGIEPGSPALQADTLPSEPPGKPQVRTYVSIITLNHKLTRAFPGASVVKYLPCNAGEEGSISSQGTKILYAAKQLNQ